MDGGSYIYSAFLGPLVRPYQAFAGFPSFRAFGPALQELPVLLLHQLDSASSFASSPSWDSEISNCVFTFLALMIIISLQYMVNEYRCCCSCSASGSSSLHRLHHLHHHHWIKLGVFIARVIRVVRIITIIFLNFRPLSLQNLFSLIQ